MELIFLLSFLNCKLFFIAGFVLHVFLHYRGGCFQLQCHSVFSIICIQSFFSSFNFINEIYTYLAATLSFGCFLCLCIGDPVVSKSHHNLIFVWEQVYKNRDVAAQLVQRAERNGYKAIVLTVDAPMLGRREADIKNKQILSPLFFSNTNHYIPFTVGYKVLHVMVFMFLSC